MQREDVERLAHAATMLGLQIADERHRTLREHHENTAAALRALLAERDAAFAAGQESMRERAAAKLDEMGRGVTNASAHPMVDKERASSLSKVMHDMAETTRALTIKPRPE